MSSISQRKPNTELGFPLRNNSAISIIPKSSTSPGSGRPPLGKSPSGTGFKPFADKELARRPRPVATATAKPYSSQVNLTNQVSLSRLPRVKQEPVDSSSLGDNSNSSDSQVRTEQRVEEVQLEDVVAEATSNSEYTRTDSNRSSNADSEPTPQKPSEEKDVRNELYASDNNQDVQTRNQETQEDSSPTSNEQHCQTSAPPVEPAKTSLKNYRHNFPSHKAQPDGSNSDDVIVEEPPPVQPVLDTTINTDDTVSPTMTPRVDPIPPRAPEATPQVYPYSQYPGYYDYSDPRSRSLASPYGAYLSGVSPQTGSLRPPPEPVKEPRAEAEKPKETGSIPTSTLTAYQQPPPPSTSLRLMEDTSKANNKLKQPVPEVKTREESLAPTAFSHPTNTRYPPGPYPPGPYDAYSQHYSTAPGSSTAYTAGGEFLIARVYRRVSSDLKKTVSHSLKQANEISRYRINV